MNSRDAVMWSGANSSVAVEDPPLREVAKMRLVGSSLLLLLHSVCGRLNVQKITDFPKR